MEIIEIGKIKSNGHNPRQIKDDKFDKLVKSLKEFPEMMVVRPIVVNKEMMVLGGNMRLKACIHAGIKKVPIEVVNWSEEKQNEFIIKDNVGFGEWDWDILANEWDSIQLDEWGLDVWQDEGATEPKESFNVHVVCENKEEVEEVKEKLRADGYNCK